MMTLFNLLSPILFVAGIYFFIIAIVNLLSFRKSESDNPSFSLQQKELGQESRGIKPVLSQKEKTKEKQDDPIPDGYKKYVVSVEGKEKAVLFRLIDKRKEVGWGGVQRNIFSGRLKDEATAKSEFSIFITLINDEIASIPSDFDTGVTKSFLQRLVVEKERKEGEAIISDIVRQIRSQAGDLL